MIIVHHLEHSRSQRVLWLLEELGVDYEIRHYSRDPETSLAPPELKEVHPLGKSPVIEDDGVVIAESGAIIDYLARRYGDGRYAPASNSKDWLTYSQWMHFAEGSAMTPFLLALYASRLGEHAAPLMPRIQSEIANHLGYMEVSLAGHDWFMGDEISAVDFQLSFVAEVAHAQGMTAQLPNLAGFVERIHAREGYKKALEKGGPYRFA